jgi:hypothetical protein
MTTIITTVWTHRRGLAVVGALAVVVLAAVAVLLFQTSSVHEVHHHLINSYHHVPKFMRTLLGAGRLGSE